MSDSGARPPVLSVPRSGAGRPRRSSFPFGVVGNESMRMNTVGTMSGRRSAVNERNLVHAGGRTCPLTVGVGGVVGGEVFPARRVVGGDDGGRGHLVVVFDDGADLVDFDAVAADLDLVMRRRPGCSSWPVLFHFTRSRSDNNGPVGVADGDRAFGGEVVASDVPIERVERAGSTPIAPVGTGRSPGIHTRTVVFATGRPIVIAPGSGHCRVSAVADDLGRPIEKFLITAPRDHRVHGIGLGTGEHLTPTTSTPGPSPRHRYLMLPLQPDQQAEHVNGCDTDTRAMKSPTTEGHWQLPHRRRSRWTRPSAG